MLPDFNRLKVFYHVYRLLSIAGAAEALHLSPSAVSQHIQKLEAELKVPLFTRLPRQLVTTPSGDRLFARLQPFVIGLEQSLQEIQAARSQPCGLLRLGAPVAFGETVLPRYMAAYLELYPDVRFHLQLGHPSLLLPAVRQGTLDFAFADVFAPGNLEDAVNRGLSLSSVVEENLILACSTPYFQHRIRGKKMPQALHGATFIAYDPFAPALRTWVKHHLGITRMKPDIVLSVESVRAVITAIEQNLGLGVVPAHLVRTALDREEITCVESKRSPVINHIAVAQLANKIPTVTEKSFIKHVEKSWCSESGG
jgi:DNA-binding transcriptional LysR family regulator